MPQLQHPSSRPSVRTPTTPSKSRTFATASTPTRAGGTASVRPRTPAQLKSPAKPKTAASSSSRPAPAEVEKSAPALSIREAIALKRAEAKKLQTKSAHTTPGSSGDAPSATSDAPAQDDDSLGRFSLRQAIERARNTGSINLATRSLPCIPSALFELHLGVTPQALESVPSEPPLPPPSSAELQANDRHSNNPSWYEAQDLQVLKAWSNDIIEIQPEISLFGSLKTIDVS
ncbi:hypothetical protein AX15_000560 [Amanita polypyramis BW_CC]|nr:hypothetical protein AX15_000560 [Amanita polypyramis BW_CC]